MIILLPIVWLLRGIAWAAWFLLTHPKILAPLVVFTAAAWLLAPLAGTVRTVGPIIIAAGTLGGLSLAAHGLITDRRANRALDAQLEADRAATPTAAYTPPERRWWEDSE